MGGVEAGRIVVISGPSGCGKTSVCAELARDPRFTRSVSATTRAPRPGERDGREYHFLADEEFRRGIAVGRFLEWAEVYGRLYGTPREPLEAAVREGRFALLNIDTQGARKLREAGVEGTFVFLLPPSLEALERRLRGRNTDDDATIRARLAEAEREMAERVHYDLAVVNDDLARAAAEIRAFVTRGDGADRGRAAAGAARP
jgi:guanylate kinase